MKLNLNGCDISNNGVDGLSIGPGVNLELNAVDTVFANNGRHGIHVEPDDLLKRLGLPDGTDPKALADLLILLKSSPAVEHTTIVERSFLGKVVDVAAFAASVVTVLAGIK